ncbi:MAG TPA: hypothetical protein VFQ85_04230, partial [Mycobacteriales bacterium]|nr:hypothetical protein [Mycobacteriales bacterium]
MGDVADANRLYYGDNLDILRRHVPEASVDLVYLDPPFNSARAYNVIFETKAKTNDDQELAQLHAFDDTWRWTQETERQFHDFVADRGGGGGGGGAGGG